MEWLKELKPGVLRFLDQMKGKRPGFFKYSLTGDICKEDDCHWGLGNTVFATKIYYMLDNLGSIDEQNRSLYMAFIKSFQNNNGEIYDPMIQRKSFGLRIKESVVLRDRGNLLNQHTRRAETRQSFAALMCLGGKPNLPYKEGIPYTKDGVERYLERLNWNYPWGAGSHFSHLLFFLRANKELFGFCDSIAEDLIDHAMKFLSRYNSKEDGSWHRKGKAISAHQKVNAAMKIITGFESVNKNGILYPDRLIDLCLSSVNDEHACNSLDLIYALYYCSRMGDYRSEEIRRFCRARLEDFRRFYWPEYGGFSFFSDRANDIYYGAKISRGLKEPDIHGTVLFLWGIVLISKILGIDNDLSFKLPIT